MDIGSWLNPTTNPILNPGVIPIDLGLGAKNKVTETVNSVKSAFTPPEKGSGKLPGGFAVWLVGIVGLSAALLLMSDSEKWSPVATALAAVIAFTVVVKWHTFALQEVDHVFGTSFQSKQA